jgi:hypothetical protein
MTTPCHTPLNGDQREKSEFLKNLNKSLFTQLSFDETQNMNEVIMVSSPTRTCNKLHRENSSSDSPKNEDEEFAESEVDGRLMAPEGKGSPVRLHLLLQFDHEDIIESEAEENLSAPLRSLRNTTGRLNWPGFATEEGAAADGAGSAEGAEATKDEEGAAAEVEATKKRQENNFDTNSEETTERGRFISDSLCFPFRNFPVGGGGGGRGGGLPAGHKRVWAWV